MRIVIADDQRLVREGIRALLEPVTGFDVVGVTGSGRRALQLVDSLEPDVLVVEPRLPELSGVEVCRRLVEKQAKTRALVLSACASPARVVEALGAGAAGYVLKNSSRRYLAKAIRVVAGGGHFVGAPISEDVLRDYARSRDLAALDPYNRLTPRERDVLPLAADGHGNVEIARRLGISPRTVEIHRANLMRKLSLITTADLIRYARSRGLVGTNS